jgi:hypothetical protein
MPYVMGAMMGAQAFMGIQEQSSAIGQSMTQRNWADQVNRLKTEQGNRDKAWGAGQQYKNNWFMTEAAAEMQGEQQFYLDMAFDNATGMISRKSKSRNDDITAALASKGMGNSQTARAIGNQRTSQQADAMEVRSLNHDNKMRGVERQTEGALKNRNFGYARHDVYVPAADFSDMDGTYKKAVMSGALKMGMAGWQAHKQNQADTKQENLDNMQKKYYDKLYESSAVGGDTLDYAKGMGYDPISNSILNGRASY